MKTRWKIVSLVFLLVVFSAVSLEADFFHPGGVPKTAGNFLPRLNYVWQGSGYSVKFEEGLIQFNDGFSAIPALMVEQEGHLLGGLIINDACPGVMYPLGGRFTGHVSTSGQVTMSLHVGCLCVGPFGETCADDTPPTHLFIGQVSGDQTKIEGVMHSLAAGDLPTMFITFTKSGS